MKWNLLQLYCIDGRPTFLMLKNGIRLPITFAFYFESRQTSTFSSGQFIRLTARKRTLKKTCGTLVRWRPPLLRKLVASHVIRAALACLGLLGVNNVRPARGALASASSRALDDELNAFHFADGLLK